MKRPRWQWSVAQAALQQCANRGQGLHNVIKRGDVILKYQAPGEDLARVYCQDCGMAMAAAVIPGPRVK